jgi:hypothetical protein
LLPMRPFVALALRTSFRSNESTRNNTRWGVFFVVRPKLHREDEHVSKQ